MPVNASNVALIDPTTNKPTRVAVKYRDDGSKVLVSSGDSYAMFDATPRMTNWLSASRIFAMASLRSRPCTISLAIIES